MAAPEPMEGLDADEVRIVEVDDGDAAPVNALLRQGWRLLACGVVERRAVDNSAQPTSGGRCTFILGRRRAEQILAAATAVVEAVEVAETGGVVAADTTG